MNRKKFLLGLLAPFIASSFAKAKNIEDENNLWVALIDEDYTIPIYRYTKDMRLIRPEYIGKYTEI